jgi:general secretion pathway protein H
MPTSPPGSDRARGFTLVEMLVTLVIIALLAGLATLSAGGNAERTARDEMSRIREVLSYARDEATFEGEELGLVVDEDAYRLLRFEPASEAWLEITEKPLDAHALPVGMSLALLLPEAPVRRSSISREDELFPEVLLSSSGEISEFRLDLRLTPGDDPVASLESDGSGSLRDL